MAAAIIGAVSLGLSMVLGGIIGQLYDGTLIPTALGFLVLGIASRVLLRFAESPRLKPART
jgi:DHA1 family bicyclomycin/chloramphenicol resistance-like MFS transporter